MPLRVCADVPDGTLKARVKFAAAPRRSGPLDVDAETCTIRTPGVQWSQVYERVPTGNTVRWVIGRLEAERYYVFCFQFEKKATDADIEDVYADNLCRCGTYLRIRQAVHRAAGMTGKPQSPLSAAGAQGGEE